MLIEIRVNAAGVSTPAFLHLTASGTVVDVAVQQAVSMHNLRLQLAELLAMHNASAGADSAERSGEKRKLVDTEAPGSADASTAAADILSPTSIGRKLVASQQHVERVLQSLGGENAPAPLGALSGQGAAFVFAGRPLEGDKLLSHYFGKNEKSKVVMSLQAEPCPAERVSDPDTASGAGASSEAVALETGVDNTAVSPAAIASAGHSTSALPPAIVQPMDFDASHTPHALPPQHEQEVSLLSFFQRTRGDAPELRLEAGALPVADPGNGDEDESVLTDSQVAAVRASAAVKSALHSRELRSILRRIDGADTRELALRRLEGALLNPDFNSFTRNVLRDLGHCTAAELS
jgi:hypothetical protein